MVASNMGIVLCTLRTEFWELIPLRSLGYNEAHVVFRQFCIIHKLWSKEVVVYCDAQQSLRKMCYIEGAPVEHPPTDRPEANPKVERKIGMALACLGPVQGGFPTCFWPGVTHACVINHHIV